MAGKGGGEAIKILLITSNIHKAQEIQDYSIIYAQTPSQ